MGKPLCISYIRFSNVSQSDGSSVERQLELSQKYAEEHGLILDDKLSYRDLGRSAYSGDHVRRGHFGEFLELVRQGSIPTGSVLLVESLDRLSRENVLDAFAQFQVIVGEDIKIVTLCDGMEYTRENLNSDFGKLIISLTIMARAYEESCRKSERIRAANRFKRQNLDKVKYTANCPTWLRLIKSENRFEVIHDRAAIVNRIFSMSYEGMGIKTIARILNHEKIQPPRSSLGWCQSSIRKILSSRSVIGEYQPHIYNRATKKHVPEGSPVPGYFPRIVEDEVYFAVQARLCNGTHISGRTAKIQNLFGGITKCGYCGARMDIVSHKNRNEISRLLVCDQARRGVKCSYISFKCNELESAFLSYCKEIDFISVLKIEGTRDQQRLTELTQQVAAKNGELLDINRQIELLGNELPQITDTLELGFFRTRLSKLLQAKAAIEDAIAVREKEINELNASMHDADNKAGNIAELMDYFDAAPSDEDRVLVRTRLRNEIRQIVKQVLVYPRGRVASDEQIIKVALQLNDEITDSDQATAEMLCHERDLVLAQMRKSQENTKDDRYFEVRFKNGNMRRFEYSKEDGTYKVTFDRTGTRIDWLMGGKPMKPLIVDEDDQLPTEEAMQG
ncbi:resolvase-like serine recombinase [Geotalea daltonii FRC-32]|uniref:Resolvase-like serine recombinase n=1 Tax=Geotalea daltonii (strain DSM 22248 / JCM 15807 / FRC-32) TaxID=316067 RepID=B9M0D0_GEODF|nr:recombinase family protein [Geotalea daltonii]ACM18967.1 resolvase-like serine recombinase [Geotalea daltonii FRC-32]